MTYYDDLLDHDSIEIYNDRKFYKKFLVELNKNSEITYWKQTISDINGEFIQSIDIVSGLLLVIETFLKIYEIYDKTKPKVIVRFKNGKVIHVNSEGVEKLRVIVEDTKKSSEK